MSTFEPTLVTWKLRSSHATSQLGEKEHMGKPRFDSKSVIMSKIKIIWLCKHDIVVHVENEHRKQQSVEVGQS